MNGELCQCGANATGHIEGRPVCCATCVFNPDGCRCAYGDPKDTRNDSSAFDDAIETDKPDDNYD